MAVIGSKLMMNDSEVGTRNENYIAYFFRCWIEVLFGQHNVYLKQLALTIRNTIQSVLLHFYSVALCNIGQFHSLNVSSVIDSPRLHMTSTIVNSFLNCAFISIEFRPKPPLLECSTFEASRMNWGRNNGKVPASEHEHR